MDKLPFETLILTQDFTTYSCQKIMVKSIELNETCKRYFFLVQAETSRSLTKHRKIASSFRDTQLFEIFQLGCSLLKKASDAIKTIDFNDADQVSIE